MLCTWCCTTLTAFVTTPPGFTATTVAEDMPNAPMPMIQAFMKILRVAHRNGGGRANLTRGAEASFGLMVRMARRPERREKKKHRRMAVLFGKTGLAIVAVAVVQIPVAIDLVDVHPDAAVAAAADAGADRGVVARKGFDLRRRRQRGRRLRHEDEIAFGVCRHRVRS